MAFKFSTVILIRPIIDQDQSKYDASMVQVLRRFLEDKQIKSDESFLLVSCEHFLSMPSLFGSAAPLNRIQRNYVESSLYSCAFHYPKCCLVMNGYMDMFHPTDNRLSISNVKERWQNCTNEKFPCWATKGPPMDHLFGEEGYITNQLIVIILL